MTINYEEINNYLNMTRNTENTLEKHQELFGAEKLFEFKQITSALEHNIKLAENKSRKLSIGIIGAVKAGKSSFLNALIFNGENYLPKAATPMTAALTKITYSDKPKAVVHFYTQDDWNNIQRYSDLYDEGLNKEYSFYLKNFAKNRDKIMFEHSSNKPMSLSEYELKYNCHNENQRGAKELTRMVKDSSLLKKLNGEEEIVGDIIHKLDDYVGANGHYTPIVSYVELQVDNPRVKDYEIVDTPGLNDPIVSRGIRTKEFLRSCDVVILLSPCSQFMDSHTVNLMANNLPEAGVREILVIGSKLDSGILNENTNDFGLAWKKARLSYETQFDKNLSNVKNEGNNLEILNKMSAEKVLFISSTCFSIARKIRENIRLDENEQKVYDNMHGVYRNYDDKYFELLGGIKQVQRALNEVQRRRNEIIEGRNTNLLDNTKNNHLRTLEKILAETVSSRNKLETTDVEALKNRSDNIIDIIDSSREKLMYIFDLAKIKSDEKIQQILPQLTIAMSQHQGISIETTTEEKHYTTSSWFGLKKETHFYNVTNNTANTARVIDNIKMYSAQCQEFVNVEFKNIFNKAEFSQNIKNVVINAFGKSQQKFDEDDILLPLNNVLAKISIPHITFDYLPYIDEVKTRFREGYARNDEIHQLRNLQSELLNKIEIEISEQLVKALKEITETLNTQAVSFADQIENELCGELEKLQKQAKEKERYIAEYRKFEQNLREMKKTYISFK